MLVSIAEKLNHGDTKAREEKEETKIEEVEKIGFCTAIIF